MENQYPQFWAHCYRLETNSWLWVQIPWEIAKSGNPIEGMEWILNEYGSEFVQQGYSIFKNKKEKINVLEKESYL